MHKQWVGCNSRNFQPGRAGFKPEAVVVHRTGGSLPDIDSRFRQAGTFCSAHYAVGTNGVIHQYVEETDMAFHAGMVVNPTWPQIRPGQNPNLYTIGIELEGTCGAATDQVQYDATAGLIAEIASRWQFAADANHVVLHREIRTGQECPGDGFDRQELLTRMNAMPVQQLQIADLEREIRILRNSNIREGAPSSTVRIVRVAPANGVEIVAGFTDQGERVQGNSYWYRLQDGNFIWAGDTECPNPIRPDPPQPVTLPAAPAAGRQPGPYLTGIPRIDQLLGGNSATPITAAETDMGAISAVQDLLTGLGFAGLPTLLSAAYGVPGAKTIAAIGSFRQQHGLGNATDVDAATLRKMAAAPAPEPRASTVYMTLVLGFPATGMQKVLSLVSQMEGAGKFAALNRNTDRAGLSFGLIQWAQRPGRLAEILNALCTADRDGFVTVFGGGDPSVADALIAHCHKPSGGVDPKSGNTVNPSFDLVSEPWISRFRQAALIARFQQVQVQLALSAFESFYNALRRFAPDLKSERAVAFMIDVANQFGDGGVVKLYADAHRSAMSETDILESIADLTVERIADPFKAGVRARRDQFLQTRLLSNGPFGSGS